VCVCERERERDRVCVCVSGGLQFVPVSSERDPLLHRECLQRFSLCSLFVLVLLTRVFVALQEEVQECKLMKTKSDEELILFIIDTKDLR